MKSRNTNSLEGFDSSVMSGNKNEFDILLVDFDEIIEKLQKEIGLSRFIKENVEKIDRQTKTINTKEYKHIVSTIPMKYLNNMINPKISEIPFESHDMTYVFTDEFQDLKDYDYVYDIRSTTPWHRMTKEKQGLVLDFFGNENNFDSIKNVIRDFKVLKNSQIISRDDVIDFPDIKFIGRYGTWNRKWKTELVIEESINE